VGGGWAAPEPTPRRARWALLALVAVVAAGAGWLVRVEPSAPGQLRVEHGADEPAPPPGPQGEDGALDALAPLGGRWVAHPPAPFVAPRNPRAVWTGGELVVLGPDRRAAALTPGGGWRELPALPGVARSGMALVWTGREVLAVGGDAPGLLDPALRDGAALDLTGATWRRLAAAPRRPRAPGVVAWTGEELLWWGRARRPSANGGEAAATVGVAYEPRTERWRELPRAPLDGVLALDGLWDGQRLLVWGSRAPDRPAGDAPAVAFALALHPSEGRWEELAAPPLAQPAAAAPVWTGSELLLWGDAAGGGARLTAAGAWRALPAPSGVSARDGAGAANGPGVWTGRFAVFSVGSPGAARRLAYDPRRDQWLRLPVDQGQRAAAVAVWTGRSLLLWGGADGEGARGDGAELQLARVPARSPAGGRVPR
jgi:hypothetical protein